MSNNHDYLADKLSKAYQVFCDKYNLDYVSADENYPIEGNQKANLWLERFLFIWNKFEHTYWKKNKMKSNLIFARPHINSGGRWYD
tara:strand:+ start:85 stop:342 length:258 start_codon:yes stop_codon:yes gene_type:complete